MNIVCIGGGTGMYSLLSGLKEICKDHNLAAVVTMMDSGGSTGRLRDEFGHLPPGDVRKCLVALSNAPLRLRKLMEYRFTSGEGLEGHTMGNLLLTALKEVLPGSVDEKEYAAIEAMEDILHIHGKVYPVTLTNCHLKATLSDGSCIRGESNIDVPKHDATLAIERLELEPSATLFEKTKQVIERADVVVVGPGDLYTSIMPNLAVQGVSEAIASAQKKGAKIVYVVSTMTKHGETDKYTAKTFVEKIATALAPATIDTIILNTGKISEEQKNAYAQEQAHPVIDDIEEDAVRGDFVGKDSFARHDPIKLATAIKEVCDVRHNSV